MAAVARLFLFALFVVFIACLAGNIHAAEMSADQLYRTLAKLPADQREKRLEEGARSEGKLNFVHTWRGKNARDHANLFAKRYPYIKLDMGDLGSQDAAERFIAEET